MFDGKILKNAKHIHFIGIGGSGMFPIVQILHGQGYHITGSDNNETDTLAFERDMGIEIFLGQRAENIKGADLIVYTIAIMDDNPELIAARESRVPLVERAELLGYLTSLYENCICVCGTHGKTTTTAMLAQVLMQSGLDPTVFIGGKLPLIGGSGRTGKSEHMVCEACEFKDHFLQLFPDVAVILNVDADHLEYFKTLDNIIKSFHQFCLQTSGCILVNGDNENAMRAVAGITHAKVLTFGRSASCDYYVSELNEEDTACEDFTIMHGDERVCRVNLHVPGEHNMMNALAAAAAAHYFGVDGAHIKTALEAFTGVHRRFEVLGKFDGVTVADDFAHHPTELSSVLSSAVRMGYHAVWAIFQPHTYSRTAMLLDDFAAALSIPDHVVMTEILAVRETNTYNIHTSDLAAKIPGSCWFDSFEEIADYVMARAEENDLILTLGGGDIYKCANLIVEKYKNR